MEEHTNAEQRIVIYNLHMIICGLHEADTIPVLIKMCQYPYLWWSKIHIW